MAEVQTTTLHYTQCPICQSENIRKVFMVADHSVSNEEFSIYHCDNCQARFTQDIPKEEDIGRYYDSEEYISHSNTDQGIINQLYQQVRKYTLNQKRRRIELLTRSGSGSLLDIGCGTGEFAGIMKNSGWRVVGLEPDSEARRQALQIQKIEAYPSQHLFELEEGDYDVVTMWHVLEHVHQLHEYLDQIKKVLKPKGYLVIAVPNYTSPDAQHYGAYWAAYDVPRHLYHFSPHSMKVLMEKHGFEIQRQLNMNLDAFYVSMLSEKYMGKSPELVRGAWQGWRSYYKTWDKPESCSSVMYVAQLGS